MSESSVRIATSLYLSKPKSTSSISINNTTPTTPRRQDKQTNKQTNNRMAVTLLNLPQSMSRPNPTDPIALYLASRSTRVTERYETSKRNLRHHLYRAMLQLPCRLQKIDPRWSAGVRGARHNASSGVPDMCRGNPLIHAIQRATYRRHRNAHRELGIRGGELPPRQWECLADPPAHHEPCHLGPNVLT
jgi:hypothetical protein